MKRATPLVALLVLACASSKPSSGTRPQPSPPPVVPVATASRVIVASFDGLGADAVAEFGAPSFTSMPLRVQRVVPVEPTVTSSTHVAILSGAGPQKSGIIANQFHKAGTPPKLVTRGLDAELSVETIADAAHKAGKRVGVIAFPTFDWKSPRRSGDWGIAFTNSATQASVIKLTRSDFRSEWVPPTWGAPPSKQHSFSPVLRARVEWAVPKVVRRDVDVVAIDTTDDKHRNYDSFYIEVPGGEPISFDPHGWFAVTARQPEGLYGSWSKILHADPALDSVVLYWGPIARSEVHPESLQRVFDDEAGFWPSQPDEVSVRAHAAGKEGLDATAFAEQNERLSAFLTKATAIAMERLPFDLLVTYQPVVDSAEHQYMVVKETQRGFSAETKAEGVEVRRRAFQEFEKAVSTYRSALKPGDALVVTGDHGIAPVDAEVRLGQLLQNLNLTPRWGVFATGSVANLYRFDAPDDSAAVMAALAALKAQDGETVLEVIRAKSKDDHPDSGDIVAFARPRFVLSSAAGDLFIQPPYYGQHGGASAHPEYHTTLGAIGAGIPTQTLESMSQTRIARFVASLLGIAPPSSAE